MARRGYESEKLPYWLMAVVFGGEVMLNASVQIMELYASVVVREIRGRIEGGVLPVWR